MIIAVHYVSANKQITIHRIFSQCLTVNLCVGCTDRVQRLPLSLKYWQTYLPQYVKNEDKSPLTSVYNADAQICTSEYMNISMQIILQGVCQISTLPSWHTLLIYAFI
jgi:hypothetical protein